MSIDPEIQQRAEEADSLKHNGTWRAMLEGMLSDIMLAWTSEQDADKREALWRDAQAIQRIEEEIDQRLSALAMEARRAERRK